MRTQKEQSESLLKKYLSSRSEIVFAYLFGSAAESESFDVVVLNDSSPQLWYEVLRNGRLVCCADENERVDREVKSLIQYYDLEPQRQRFAKDIQTMIQEGAF